MHSGTHDVSHGFAKLRFMNRAFVPWLCNVWRYIGVVIEIRGVNSLWGRTWHTNAHEASLHE